MFLTLLLLQQQQQVLCSVGEKQPGRVSERWIWTRFLLGLIRAQTASFANWWEISVQCSVVTVMLFLFTVYSSAK